MVWPSQFRPRKGRPGDFGSSWGSPGTRWFTVLLSATALLLLLLAAFNGWVAGLAIVVGILGSLFFTVVRRAGE